MQGERHALLNQDSVFNPAVQERSLVGLLAKVNTEYNREKRIRAAQELVKLVTVERYDALSVLRAIDVGMMSLVEGRMGTDIGTLIFEGIQSYTQEQLAVIKFLRDDSHMTLDAVGRVVDPIRQHYERYVSHNAVSAGFRKYPEIFGTTNTIFNIYDNAKKGGLSAAAFVQMMDQRFVEITPSGGSRGNEDAQKNTRIQNLIIKSWVNFVASSNEGEKLLTPQVVVNSTKESEALLNGDFPSYYDRQLNGVSLRMLEQQEDLTKFCHQSLQFMAACPPGNVVWSNIMDMMFVNSSNGIVEKDVDLTFEQGDELPLKLQVFNGWVATNLLGPSMDINFSPDPEFDRLFGQAVNGNMRHTFICGLVDLLFNNYIGMNGLAAIKSLGPKYVAELEKIRRVFPSRIDEYHADPNKIVDDFIQTSAKSIGNLATRFPEDRLWQRELFLQERIEMGNGHLAKNGIAEIRSGIPIIEQSLEQIKAAEGSNNYLWGLLEPLIGENKTTINESLDYSVVELDMKSRSGTGYSKIRFSVIDKGIDQDGIHFEFGLPSKDVSLVEYNIKHKLDPKTGELTILHPDDEKVEPAIKALLRLQSLLFLYRGLEGLKLISRERLFDSHLNGLYGGVKVDDPNDEEEQQVVELTAVQLLAQSKKITYASLEDSLIPLEVAKKYPGGLQALRAKAQEFVPNMEKPPAVEILADMLRYLEENN